MTRYIYCLTLLLPLGILHAADKAATNTPSAIPWNQIGAKAGADYQGDGLTVTPTPSGAQLHCVFQRLDGEATPEGLWLTSTVNNTTPDRFRVTAIEIRRKAANAISPAELLIDDTNRDSSPSPLNGERAGVRGEKVPLQQQNHEEVALPLPTTGSISISAQTVRFTRPSLTEEYTVSMDGLRQDFIIEQPPASREASWTAAVPSLPYPQIFCVIVNIILVHQRLM